MFAIGDEYVRVGVEAGSEREGELVAFLSSSFPRRYIPSYNVYYSVNSVDCLVQWLLEGRGFEVVKLYREGGLERYIIRSPAPEPYVNESPVFFLLQVFARAYARKGYIVFTDSIAIHIDGKTVLLMGYPHSGKSTLTAISISRGDVPLTTENTVVEPTSSGLRVINGTSVLVYDPRLEDLYGVKLKYSDTTRHGYRVVDLDEIAPDRRAILRRKPLVDEMYVLHCSYSAGEPSLEPVSGRKVKKILWHFVSSLLLGLDYYEPYPQNLLDGDVLEKLVSELNEMSEIYGDKMSEVYGAHDKAYDLVRER